MSPEELLTAMVLAFVRPVIEDYPDIRVVGNIMGQEDGRMEVQLGGSKAFQTFKLECDLPLLLALSRELRSLNEPDPRAVVKLLLKEEYRMVMWTIDTPS